MPTLKTSGARIAFAGTAAAALTLAAASPVLAQDGGYYPDDEVSVGSTIHGGAAPEGSSWSDFGLSDEGVGARITVADVGDTLGGLDAVTTSFHYGDLDFLEFEFPTDGGLYECTDTDEIFNCTVNPDGGVVDIWFKIIPTEDAQVGDEGLYSLYGALLSDGSTLAEWEDASFVVDQWLLDEAGLGEDGGEIEPTEPPVEEDPNEADGGFEYEFAFLNHVLSGANPGETLAGAPQIRVNGDSSLGEDRAATVVYFGDSIDTDLWIDEGEVEFTEAVEVVADYDNCVRWDHEVYCVLTDFDPQVGSTYTPSEDTPVLFEVLKAVTDADGAYYGAYDINQEGLDEAIADGLDPAGDDVLTLVETDMEISDEYFSDYYGFVFFEGDDRGWGDVPSTGGSDLPKTGSSMTIVLTSALGAVVAGAVVFFLMRRRKVAQNWG